MELRYKAGRPWDSRVSRAWYSAILDFDADRSVAGEDVLPQVRIGAVEEASLNVLAERVAEWGRDPDTFGYGFDELGAQRREAVGFNPCHLSGEQLEIFSPIGWRHWLNAATSTP
jgi:hypothetical protein